MSTFKGSLTSKLQENHQFFSEDMLLQSISLVSFTKSSCPKIYNQNRKLLDNNPLFDPLPRKLEDEQTILNIGSNLTMEYTEFNVGAEQFNATKTSIGTLEELYGLIDYHENVQFNSNFARVKANDDKIIAINNSLEKAVVCKFNLLNTDLKVLVKFQERSNRNNERGIALQNVTIAGTPSTPDGRRYSQKATQDHQSSSTGNINTYLPSSQSSFSQDAVAGKLDMFFDNNTGKWKAGTTQILARMLEDLPPADIGSLDGIDLINSQVTDILARTGKFSVGKAIALSKQHGNPHLFGPNFEECLARNKVELRIVNRSLKGFKKDEVVMLSEIGGEWIPQSFGEDKDFQSPTRFEDWAFVKLIANTDSYFKDDRYYTTGETAYLTDIKPADYEKSSRIKFYTNVLTSWSNRQAFEQDGIQRPALTQIYNGDTLKQIQNLNIGNESDDFIPSKRYYLCSIFDQLKTDVGGFNEKTILLSTNVEAPNTFRDTSFKYAEEMPLFWGPVYVDGFSKFAYNPEAIYSDNQEKFFGPVTDTDESALQYFPRSGNLLHIPAECGSLFINPFSVWKYWNQLGQSGFRIITPYIKSPYYGTSTPVSKNKIQFSPLQAEFAGGDDTMSKFLTPAYSFQREFFNVVRRLADVINGGLILGETYNSKLMGNTYERSAYFGYDEANVFITQQELEKCAPIYDIAKYNEAGALKTIRYQCYTKRDPQTAGGRAVGAPALFRGFGSRNGAHCVGIISAKNTVGKPGGGKLNYSLIQDFGLNQQRTSSAASISPVNVILGVVFGGVSSGGIQTGVPQWGSDTDSISSFGTTALHVRIFDYWPEEQTIFDPRYFAVLHFNPGCYYNTENANNDTLTVIDNENPTKTQQRVANSKKVDIPIPTRSDGTIVKNGELIFSNTSFLEKNKWKMNPIRRGALLTGGGFTYKYHVIGLPETPAILFAGTGISTDTFSIASRNLKIKLTLSNGSVVAVRFEKDALQNDMRGDNFIPSDFNQAYPTLDSNGNPIGTDRNLKGFIVQIQPQQSGGKPAILAFPNGVVWLKIAKDEAPVQHGPITRLSSSSKRGEGFIEETKDTSLDLGANSSGKYDCFYHFHNDITHTLILPQPFTAGFLQYVSMTIT